ncbi:hypothetical protein EVAR_57198_1 [Eumeta japonica]|uniref:Uncharacterized protein n=1 Tax=Eumeta variegata TaxID=151549 RepID=A0A4C1Z2A7_EUMVA|nr:hypothetical protein EVAR_57198_1 [Eumeta japonica]
MRSTPGSNALSTDHRLAPGHSSNRKLHRTNSRTWGKRRSEGLRLRTVALFMDSNTERRGISFCCASGPRTMISPGLAFLLNGATLKTGMKLNTFEGISQIEVGGKQVQSSEDKKSYKPSLLL